METGQRDDLVDQQKHQAVSPLTVGRWGDDGADAPGPVPFVVGLATVLVGDGGEATGAVVADALQQFAAVRVAGVEQTVLGVEALDAQTAVHRDTDVRLSRGMA
jgi:hypothetical protein